MDKQSSQKETFRSIWFKYHSLKTPYYFVLLQGRQISAKLAIFYKLIVLIFSGFLCYCQGQVQSTRTLQKLVGPSALYLVIRQIDRQIDRHPETPTDGQTGGEGALSQNSIYAVFLCLLSKSHLLLTSFTNFKPQKNL